MANVQPLAPNSAIHQVDGKWVPCAVQPATYDLTSADFDAACAANPKNTIQRLPDGSLWFFDHFGVPLRLDAGAKGDQEAANIEAL
ncbi:MAG: hypothetical protein K6T78_15785 [Alicyclobacillus sp.]|nr:hypothetical protein [Alicyclobacillus sp.]